MLAVTFGTKLVALVAGPGYSAPYRPANTGCPSAVWVLPVFPLGTGSGELLIVHSDMLLEILESIV